MWSFCSEVKKKKDEKSLSSFRVPKNGLKMADFVEKGHVLYKSDETLR